MYVSPYLESKERQLGIFGMFKMAAKIQDGQQSRRNLLVLFYEQKLYLKDGILCSGES